MLVGCACWDLWLSHDPVLLGSVMIWLEAVLLDLDCADLVLWIDLGQLGLCCLSEI